jgi:hypothetical protein
VWDQTLWARRSGESAHAAKDLSGPTDFVRAGDDGLFDCFAWRTLVEESDPKNGHVQTRYWIGVVRRNAYERFAGGHSALHPLS